MLNEALDNQANTAQPHVIIVGGGFGGPAAARALALLRSGELVDHL